VERAQSAAALPVLLDDLTLARAVFAQSRHGAAAGPSVNDARALVAPLVAYTAALTECRLPVPYLLRDDLRLRLRISGRDKS
jgi:hypothetical protein